MTTAHGSCGEPMSYGRVGIKHTLVVKYIDKYPTDAERKRHVPRLVRPEDWEEFVDICSTKKHHLSRERGKTARGTMNNPHTTGRRGGGAASTAEELRKNNPDGTISRTELYIATHTRKDGAAPTPVSQHNITY